MLKHADIWRAIDRLAERNGLSPSGLARKAGLSPTLFNPSKRSSAKRKRWPSTESVAQILQATNTSLDDFVTLANIETAPRQKLPLININEAIRTNPFDENGLPKGPDWDPIDMPTVTDPQAFALEIGDDKGIDPFYREGSKIILSPAEKPRRGDRVALRLHTGEILLRHMGREGGQKIELLPLQSLDIPPLTFSRAEIDWIYRIIWASQ